jgi:hypothetical protein
MVKTSELFENLLLYNRKRVWIPKYESWVSKQRYLDVPILSLTIPTNFPEVLKYVAGVLKELNGSLLGSPILIWCTVKISIVETCMSRIHGNKAKKRALCCLIDSFLFSLCVSRQQRLKMV